eukprot:CAMPEP_0185759322 /NCGR_PEP_ID=MMETSP1174-20130828/18070_1 /TAXON_ID=35687 /ORGANISM="Dictyocha speculum, Strain CCMP1381" /LENGTH=151 /DNA_ID=CAMNT_0028439617 /DNA_START=58 /DNA_END=513 /DNA_ORIENTATION=+
MAEAEPESRKLSASEQVDSRIETLVQMGFEGDKAERALLRANGDWDAAITLLTNDRLPEEDHFDLLAREDSKGPAATTPAVVKPRAKSKEEDHFMAGLPADAPVSAIVDNRIQQMIDMGFDAEDAEAALKASGNDFEKAVHIITTTDETSA